MTTENKAGAAGQGEALPTGSYTYAPKVESVFRLEGWDDRQSLLNRSEQLAALTALLHGPASDPDCLASICSEHQTAIYGLVHELSREVNELAGRVCLATVGSGT